MQANNNTNNKTLSFIFLAASGLIQISCSNNSSTPIATTIPPSPISAVAIPVATDSNGQGKNKEYTPQVINQYISVCKSGGIIEVECSCFINKAKEIYTLSELIRINNEAINTKKNPPKIEELLQTCKQEQLALINIDSFNQQLPVQNTESTSDTEPDSFIDSDGRTVYIPSSSRNTNIRGYTRKDGTYVQPHTRSSNRVSGFSSSRSSSSS